MGEGRIQIDREGEGCDVDLNYTTTYVDNDELTLSSRGSVDGILVRLPILDFNLMVLVRWHYMTTNTNGIELTTRILFNIYLAYYFVVDLLFSMFISSCMC